MISEAFSATMIVGIFVLQDGITGIIEASITRSPFTPFTLKIYIDLIFLNICANIFFKYIQFKIFEKESTPSVLQKKNGRLQKMIGLLL